jgi:hypothetical protein
MVVGRPAPPDDPRKIGAIRNVFPSATTSGHPGRGVSDRAGPVLGGSPGPDGIGPDRVEGAGQD